MRPAAGRGISLPLTFCFEMRSALRAWFLRQKKKPPRRAAFPFFTASNNQFGQVFGLTMTPLQARLADLALSNRHCADLPANWVGHFEKYLRPVRVIPARISGPRSPPAVLPAPAPSPPPASARRQGRSHREQGKSRFPRSSSRSSRSRGPCRPCNGCA